MTTPSSHSTSRFNAIFRNSDGLKTGWSVLLYLGIIALVLAVIGYADAVLHHPLPHAPAMKMSRTVLPGRFIFTECSLAFAVLTATFVMGKIERKSWLDYGWRGPRQPALLVQGLLAGIVLMAILMGLLVLTHGATVRYNGIGWSALTSGATWALGFALVALFEETLFRGYLFFLLLNRHGPRYAVIIMALMFGVAHMNNHGENVQGVLQVVAFGLVLCLAVWRTGSLWWALGFHAAWDWSESFLFGAADSGNVMQGHLLTTSATGPTWLSGGSAGPEGSLFILPLLALMVVWIMFFLSKRPPGRARESAPKPETPGNDQASIEHEFRT